MASAAGVLVLPPLPGSHPQQAVPGAAAWSEPTAVLEDANIQQQQACSGRQQGARSGDSLQEEQQQQLALQQCHERQQLGYTLGQQQQFQCLSGQQQQSVRQTDAHASTVQQPQQQAEQCLGAHSCAGTHLQQQQEGNDQEGMQLFSCARMMKEDLKAYATLVHGAQSR